MVKKKRKKSKIKAVASEMGGICTSKFFKDEVKEKLKEKLGEEPEFPLLALVVGKKMVIIAYMGTKNYKKGESVFVSDKDETIEEFYKVLREIK